MSTGVTHQNIQTRQKYWNFWQTYCAQCKTNPYLDSTNKIEQSILLTGYAARVRTGIYGRGNQVKVQTVTDALSAMANKVPYTKRRENTFYLSKDA